MSIFAFIGRSGRPRGAADNSAAIARNRLTVLLAHESASGTRSDLLGLLHEKILAVIQRHVPVRPDQIQVKMHRGVAVSTLEIEIEIPA